MGMYTELVLKCEVRGDAPIEVMEVIGNLFGQQQEPESLPNHEFFKCQRWDFIGKHDSTSTMKVRPWSLRGDLEIFSYSSLKNYDSEIEKFIDWITPYLCYSHKKCIGWSWYEEEDKPKLIIIKAGEQA